MWQVEQWRNGSRVAFWKFNTKAAAIALLASAPFLHGTSWLIKEVP